jgi:hypothetical protein
VCGTEAKSVTHLFIYCDFARQVWIKVFSWLGLKFSLPHNLFSILNLLRDSVGKKAKKKGLILIWSVVV